MRPTVIALTAIPVSILVTALVFNFFGLSINTMTLGGLAIAIGGLVDDAVVDVENMLRRLRENAARAMPAPGAGGGGARRSMEVRSGIVYATVIMVLVFLPLFALPGLEGRLFVPLGVAYIVVDAGLPAGVGDVTPVLAYYLLPRMSRRGHGDSACCAWLKGLNRAALLRALARPRLVCGAVAVLLLGAAGRALLPAPSCRPSTKARC